MSAWTERVQNSDALQRARRLQKALAENRATPADEPFTEQGYRIASMIEDALTSRDPMTITARVLEALATHLRAAEESLAPWLSGAALDPSLSRHMEEALSVLSLIPRSDVPIDGAESSVPIVETLEAGESRQLEIFVRQIRVLVEAGELDSGPEDAAVLEAEQRTLEAQLRSPRPNRGVVRSALASVGRILEGGVGNALGSAAFELLRRLG